MVRSGHQSLAGAACKLGAIFCVSNVFQATVLTTACPALCVVSPFTRLCHRLLRVLHRFRPPVPLARAPGSASRILPPPPAFCDMLLDVCFSAALTMKAGRFRQRRRPWLPPPQMCCSCEGRERSPGDQHGKILEHAMCVWHRCQREDGWGARLLRVTPRMHMQLLSRTTQAKLHAGSSQSIAHCSVVPDPLSASGTLSLF